ncbi:MAG: SEC-C domain-containing protein [Desulfobacterales bacterium]|nr:MAG: SEC-C domain-containing protein [Desulfobacterales bacterium]
MKQVSNDHRNNNLRRTTKIGRNQPCPCGSGKKYKSAV